MVAILRLLSALNRLQRLDAEHQRHVQGRPDRSACSDTK